MLNITVPTDRPVGGGRLERALRSLKQGGGREYRAPVADPNGPAQPISSLPGVSRPITLICSLLMPWDIRPATSMA